MLQSTLVSKTEKAHRYSKEPDRLDITTLRATFKGDNDVYELEFSDGHWNCACDFFGHYAVCCHVEATSRMFADSLAETAQVRISDYATIGVAR